MPSAAPNPCPIQNGLSKPRISISFETIESLSSAAEARTNGDTCTSPSTICVDRLPQCASQPHGIATALPATFIEGNMFCGHTPPWCVIRPTKRLGVTKPPAETSRGCSDSRNGKAMPTAPARLRN